MRDLASELRRLKLADDASSPQEVTPAAAVQPSDTAEPGITLKAGPDAPRILCDTCVLKDLAEVAADKDHLHLSEPLSRLIVMEGFPEFAVTGTILCEIFGRHSIDHKGRGFLLASCDSKDRIRLKPWNEIEKELRKNPTPQADPKLDFFKETHHTYNLLKILADANKLLFTSVEGDRNQDRPTKFSGYAANKGEVSLAEAELKLHAAGRTNMFILTEDKAAVMDVLRHPGNESRVPVILDEHKFFYGLEKAGLIPEAERIALVSQMPRNSGDVMLLGRGVVPDNKAMVKEVSRRASDLLADAIRQQAANKHKDFASLLSARTGPDGTLTP